MKKATNKDLDRVLGYIGKDYGKCLYLYLDINEYGLEDENISLWYDETGSDINVIVMKYFTGMHIYSKNLEFDREAVVDLIKSQKPNMISSMSDIAKYVDYIPEGYIREEGSVVKHQMLFDKIDEEIVEASLEDLPDICRLLETDEELGKPYGYDLLYKQLSDRLKRGFGRNVIIRKEGKVIAHCATYAEGYGVGVSGGLIVHDDYKGKGIGTKILNAISIALSKENKEHYGYIYILPMIKMAESTGSEIIGGWTKIFKEEIE